MDKSSWGRGLPYEQWPAQDRAVWENLTRKGDDFEETGPLARLRQTSRDAYRLSYAQWLQFLRDAGVDLQQQSPDARVTLQRLRRYHEAIANHSPRSKAGRFTNLHHVLSKAFPQEDWLKLRNAANSLTRCANRTRGGRDHDHLPPSDALLDAGLSTISAARSCDDLTPLAARRWRDGLIVALLACHAPRRRMLAALTLGRNIKRDDQGYAVWASDEDVKAGRSCMFRISSLLQDSIEAYLVQARPKFPNGCDPESGPLWLTFTGRALGAQGIRNAVAEITEAKTQVRATPHSFRHAAMTTMANAEGFDTRYGQAFLDHRTSNVSERHYNLATQLDAGRVYANLLEKTYKQGGN